MKKTLLLLLFLPVALFWLLSCGKDPDSEPPKTEEEKLPPITQEGRMTFGCLIDGKAWIPKGSGLIDPGVQPSYNELTGEFQIFSQKFFDKNLLREYLTIVETGIKMTDSFDLTEGQSSYRDTFKICAITGLSTNRRYLSIHGGVILISKIDILAGILAGTFEFDAYNADCQDTVKITKGRFDIKYK